MPFEVRFHRHKQIVLYASEPRIIDAPIGDDAEWEEIPLVPGEALTINTVAIHAPCRQRFTFEGMAHQVAQHRFSGI
jgi:hypothetical protein